jgi:hypothetical protein
MEGMKIGLISVAAFSEHELMDNDDPLHCSTAAKPALGRPMVKARQCSV